MGSVLAIIFGLIAMLPLLLLLVQLQTLVLHPRKLLASLRCRLTESRERDISSRGKRNLVQYYPKLPDLLNSNSESRLVVCAARSVLSSPAVPERIASAARHHRLVNRTIPLVRHSSSFVATRIVLPVVDITCDYNSCRHATFEQSLRQRYGGASYPPGEVVLNYIHLNTPDSGTTGNDDDRVSDDLLDFFVDSNDNRASVPTKLEAEYLNLLDHFVLKRRVKAATAGKFTETLPPPDERNLEMSSHVGTWSQSTLRSSVAQEKESRSSGSNQRSLKSIERNQGSSANRRPNSSQRTTMLGLRR